MVDRFSFVSRIWERLTETVKGTPKYTEKGFVYSDSQTAPTIADQKKQYEGSGDGDFSIVISNLKYDKRYCFRAYAKTKFGYTYGEVKTFSTY